MDMKKVFEEKKNLENKINRKNEEIETLNLKVVQMTGHHKRALDKLEDEVSEAKKEHNDWLERQVNETNQWHAEKKELNDKIEELNKQIHDNKKRSNDKEKALTDALNEKGMEIANLKGTIAELQNKIKHLSSKNQVEKENVEKTMLETRTIMNTEKDKLMDTSKKEKHLQHGENSRVRGELDRQIDDLKKQNNILLDNYQKSQLREE